MAERPDGASRVRVTAFELGDRLFERLHRRRAEPPIGEVLRVGLERRERWGTESVEPR